MESSRIGDRTEREANSLPQYTPNFDPYRNSPWRARHVALGQFQQAARTILIRIRAEDRLSKLRKLMKVNNQGSTGHVFRPFRVNCYILVGKSRWFEH